MLLSSTSFYNQTFCPIDLISAILYVGILRTEKNIWQVQNLLKGLTCIKY